jgi:hypothetical protein
MDAATPRNERWPYRSAEGRYLLEVDNMVVNASHFDIPIRMTKLGKD